MPSGLLVPYSDTSTRPATTVGRAKGRSMSVSMIRLPGKVSRTSSQAMSVPITALMMPTISEATTVSLMVERASGVVMSAQNPAQPFSVAVRMTAPSGRITTKPRIIVAMPSSMPVLGRRRRRRLGAAGAAGTRSGGASTSAVLLGLNRDSDGALDVSHDRSLRVEELLGGAVPAAEVGDGEQAARRGELVGAGHALDHRAVAVLDEDLLGLGGGDVGQQRLGRRGVLGILGHGRRVLDEDRRVGHDVVEVLALLLGEDRLVLVAEQHVALAAGEGLERLAGAVVLHHDVLVEVVEVLHPGGLVLALVAVGAVGRQHVPAGAARGERVGVDDLDARLGQVGPGLDALGIALAHDEDRDRIGDHALGLVLVPVVGDLAALDQAGHVRLEGEAHVVGRLATVDGPALVTGGAEGVLELQPPGPLGLLERLLDLLVRLLGGGVGHQADGSAQSGSGAAPRRRSRRVGLGLRATAPDREHSQRGGDEHGGPAALT